jgi:hypothetical protein
MQPNGHACGIGRALLRYWTWVMDMPYFRDRHGSISSHDLLGVGSGIARSPSTGFDLGDELGHHTVEQGGFLQVQGMARLREHGEAGAPHGSL